MQIIYRKPDVLDDSERCKIFMLLTGKHVTDILETISDKPRSVIEISKICNICTSNVYRTLNKLSRFKLVKITGSIGIDGKKSYLYQSKIKSITMTLNSECCPVVTIFGTSNKST
jgi:predicted transcriptional regulator